MTDDTHAPTDDGDATGDADADADVETDTDPTASSADERRGERATPDGGTGVEPSDVDPHEATAAPRATRQAPEQGLDGPAPDERPHPEGRRNSQGIRIDPETEAEPRTRTAVMSARVAHEPGVLARVSGLFSRRQFNIESLTVGPTEDPDVARITLVVEEHEPGLQQVKKQLAKLVPVRSVTELAPDAIRRELALVKVAGDEPDKVAAVAEMYDGKTVDATPDAITVEVTGGQQKVEAAVDAFRQFGVLEVKRTGTAALERGQARTGGAAETSARADGGDTDSRRGI
jgi:acetolactate synthase-1/3 small subunit